MTAITFAQFLASDPELTDFARAMYRQIDGEALRIGTEIANQRATEAPNVCGPDSSAWLIETRRETDALLARDVRLAAYPSLCAAAQDRDGIGRCWVNWYAELLNRHVAQLEAGAVTDDDFHRSLEAVRKEMEKV